MKKHKNFIGGAWKAPLSNQWMRNINPATSDCLGLYPRSGGHDIEKAVLAARSAFRSWRATPAPIRATYLMKAADFLASQRDSFARDLCQEMGKPWKECVADIQEAIDMALFCAGEGRRNLGMVTSSEIWETYCSSSKVPNAFSTKFWVLALLSYLEIWAR